MDLTVMSLELLAPVHGCIQKHTTETTSAVFVVVKTVNLAPGLDLCIGDPYFKLKLKLT